MAPSVVGPNTFDFNEAYSTLSSPSTAVKNSSTPSSTVTNSPSGGITLTGTHSDSNTFNVTAAQFSSGGDVSSGQGQSALNGVNMVQSDGAHIIYNFTETTTINLYSHRSSARSWA